MIELTDKVIQSVPLTDNNWKELCELLSRIKGLDINSCDSCRSYLTALLGGRHNNWLNLYLNKPATELEKGIRSLDKQIIEHSNKIQNPKKYYPDWENLDSRNKQNLIEKKWKQDIQRQLEQKQILECILRNRVN